MKVSRALVGWTVGGAYVLVPIALGVFDVHRWACLGTRDGLAYGFANLGYLLIGAALISLARPIEHRRSTFELCAAIALLLSLGSVYRLCVPS